MNDLREHLDRRAAGFTPDRAAYERVLNRAALRRVRRRITAGVTALAISAAAFTGLWAATHGSDSVSVATPVPSSIAEVGGLRIGLAVHLPRGIGDVLATHWVDTYGVYAATPGSLFGIDPSSGYVKRTASPGWDPEAVRLADYGEGSIFAAWGTRVGEFGNGVQGPVVKLATRVVGAVMYGDSGLWVTEWTGKAWILVRIDPTTGETVGAGIPVGQGRHSIVEADGYVFVAGPVGDGPSMVRVDPRNGSTQLVSSSSTGGLAAVGSNVWGVDGDVSCVDTVTLAACGGDVHVPRAAAVAADGDRVWVLSATGSKDASVYIPDPDQPATVTLIDGSSGAVLAGPIPLPDVTPAYISAANGHAWVGFYDSGLLLRVDICPDPGCSAKRRFERVVRIQQRISALDATLQVDFARLDELRAMTHASPRPSAKRQIRATQEQIRRIEERRVALVQLLDRLAPG
jgi:hypothetical protein